MAIDLNLAQLEPRCSMSTDGIYSVFQTIQNELNNLDTDNQVLGYKWVSSLSNNGEPYVTFGAGNAGSTEYLSLSITNPHPTKRLLLVYKGVGGVSLQRTSIATPTEEATYGIRLQRSVNGGAYSVIGNQDGVGQGHHNINRSLQHYTGQIDNSTLSTVYHDEFMEVSDTWVYRLTVARPNFINLGALAYQSLALGMYAVAHGYIIDN